MMRMSVFILLLVCVRARNRPNSRRQPHPLLAPRPRSPSRRCLLRCGANARRHQDALLRRVRGSRAGSKGEELTVKFLEDQFKKIGLQPGNTDGTFVQSLPLGGPAGTPRPPAGRGGGKKARFGRRDELGAWTKRVPEPASIENSGSVLAGGGGPAPEFKWDDFKDVDVKGKTIVVLINDPQVPSAVRSIAARPRALQRQGDDLLRPLDLQVRGGRAPRRGRHPHRPRDRSGRISRSRRPGQSRERFDLVTPDKNMGRASIEGWLTLDAAKKLLAQAGQDFDALKKQALTREFRPVPLGCRPRSPSATPAHDSIEERASPSSKAATRSCGTSTSSTRRTGITSAKARP